MSCNESRQSRCVIFNYDAENTDLKKIKKLMDKNKNKIIICPYFESKDIKIFEFESNF